MKENMMNHYFEYLDTFFPLERFEFPEITFLTAKAVDKKAPTYKQWEKKHAND